MLTLLSLVLVAGLALANTDGISKNDSTLSAVNANAILNKNKEVCMKELGCFSITDDFKHPIYRPGIISVLPNDRATINTQFHLYTKKNAKEPEYLYAHDEESFTKSNLDPANPTKFIVHGFMDSQLFGPWMVNMKDEFLLHGDYNIIIIEWSGGNKPPYYQASSNTRVVGAETALLIKALDKYMDIKPENLHIIGHSLGAHVAGYAGERLKTLGRITGCDPAEPYFQNMPKNVRLDQSDADYVDVIHSDATTILLLGFGMSQVVGHADFFPNNGRKQPGCKTDKFLKFITDGLTEGSRRFSSCNHQRSLDFMHFSLNYRKVVPVGFECSNWESFLEGKCADCGPDTKKCAVMGIRADEYKQFRNSSVQHSFFLKTSGKAPFWLYHYQVTVKLHKPRTSFKDVKGTFEVNLHGSREDFLAKMDIAQDLIHGARYQYLVTTDTEIGDVKSVTLKWFSSSLNPIGAIFKPKLYVSTIQVLPMNVIEKSPRNMTGRVFCGNPDNAITPKTVVSFQKDDACMKYL